MRVSSLNDLVVLYLLHSLSLGIPKQYGRVYVLGQELLSRPLFGGGAGQGYR